MSPAEMLNTEITILHVDGAPAPDLPSHLFPGCGSDGAEFKVTAGPILSYGDMNHLLYEAIVDACLVEYDESTGEGYFKVVDAKAPPVGSVLLLDHALITKHDMPDEAGVYMYDEWRYGSTPTPEKAARILADLKVGRAIPHPIAEPGYEQRLEDIVVGRQVDPSFYPARTDDNVLTHLSGSVIEATTVPNGKEPITMDKKSIRKRIAELQAQGVSKKDIFQELKGGSYSDSRLAYILASRADINLVRAHKWKTRIMITVAIIQMTLAFLVGWQVGEPVSTGYALLGALLACAIPALTAYGFIHHNVAAYNLFIVVSLFQYWIQVRDVMQGYNAAWIGVAFATVMLTFVIYLRLQLFPEVRAFMPAKDSEGQYAFA
jgi:hypothetical protein